jgi:hypothetical protein
MAWMLDTIHVVTGYDPAACADLWLRSTTTTAFGACPWFPVLEVRDIESAHEQRLWAWH